MSKIYRIKFLVLIVILVGAFLRFYKLDWGDGLFTHPDEYHIVISVYQLSFPSQMNPHFFSYGTVIIYLIYFTKEVINYLLPLHNIFFLSTNPFIIGRFYSAFFSTLTILVIYRLGSLVWTTRVGLLAAALTALTPGLIQQAHFLTPESTLIFFLLISLYFCLQFLRSTNSIFLILSSIALGLSLGVKVSTIPALVLPILTIVLTKHFSFLSSVKKITLTLTIVTLTLFVVDPFTFLDFPHFRDNIQYEGALAAGQLDVFYTRQFIGTTPFLFQLTKIYPFALGPTLLIFGLAGLVLILIKSRLSRDQLLVVTLFLLILIPNSLLFAKWTRFSSPTFPFFALFASYLISELPKAKSFLLAYTLQLLLISTAILWTLAFFSIYLKPDIRLTASSWIISNLPESSKFLVEGGNMVDIPSSGNFQRLSLDFYTLDTEPLSSQKIATGLANTDYFIVESRRVFKNHLRLSNLYPKTASLYNNLFNGKLGFKEIKEFTSFPQLNFVGLNLTYSDEDAEETWSVFDHPVIRIFQKKQDYSTDYYLSLMNNTINK